MFLLKLMLLPMLIKVLDRTGRPLVCASFYALGILTNGLIFDLAFGAPPATIAVAFALALAASSAFFVLLHVFDSTPWYWAVLTGGILGLLWMP